MVLDPKTAGWAGNGSHWGIETGQGQYGPDLIDSQIVSVLGLASFCVYGGIDRKDSLTWKLNVALAKHRHRSKSVKPFLALHLKGAMWYIRPKFVQFGPKPVSNTNADV